MQVIKEISSAEMVGQFLKAELHSSRFRPGSLKALKMLGLDETLLETEDYSNDEANQLREKVLGLCRGWPDEYLFTNFPRDTTWFQVELSFEELKASYRLKSSEDMPDTERQLSTTADKVMHGETVRNIDNEIIHQICQSIIDKAIIPPIILVGTSFESKRVLIEGHSRSVAYACLNTLDQSVPAIMGISKHMDQWEYF